MDDKTVKTPPPELSGSEPTLVTDSKAFLVVDLTSDPLLRNLPQSTFQGHTVPVLAGIPLLEKLGQGGMGAVYRGIRVMLEQEVAVKVLPLHLAARQDGLTDRFVREAQIASRIESPHLVRVTDVNEFEGLFYLVMEYVRGISAARLIRDQQSGIAEAAALDVCIAACRGLAAAHTQGIIHRDIKPDNILIPQTREGELLLTKAKVADLGLARKEEAEGGLTASNIGMGTPGYMAPEQAMSARHAAKASDVFGMGATLYGLLAGHAPFTGDSAASIIIATVQQPHPPIRQLRPEVSEATSRLLDQCLQKDPGDRYVDGPALLEALQVCRDAVSDSTMQLSAMSALANLQNRTEVGEPVRASVPPAGGAPPAPTVVGATAPRKNRTMAIGIAALIVVVLAALVWANRSRFIAAPAMVIACSPEQAEWMQWSAQEFAKTDTGKGTSIRILRMGAEEAQRNVLSGDQRINVWIPISGLTRSVFEANWKAKYPNAPIARAEVLGVTPHIFVMVKSRYDEFVKKHNELTFNTLRTALMDPGGWGSIAGKPEWGRFTFALTKPSRNFGGLTNLTLMAYDFRQKDQGLTVADVLAPDFTEWARGFDRAFNVKDDPAGALQTFVLKGPSSYDGLSTFESAVIDKLDDIEDRWGPAQLVYPQYNIWNESSYYVIDAPWSTPKSKKLANDFADFLLSEPAQMEMVRRGFRPANPRVKIQFEGSPFKTYASRGLLTEVPVTVDVPDRDVVDALIKEASVISPLQ